MRQLLKNALIICLIISSNALIAQRQHLVDSLKKIIATTKDDAVKLKAYSRVNDINENTQETIEGFKQQVLLSKKLKENKAACYGLCMLGFFAVGEGDFIAAQKYLDEGVELSKRINNEWALARFYQIYMTIYASKGDLSNTIEMYKKSESYFLKLHDFDGLSRLYNNASEAYKLFKLYPQSIEIARKAYATSSAINDSNGMIVSLYFVGNALMILNKYDSAIACFDRSLIIAKKMRGQASQADMMFGLSEAYSQKKQYTVAKQYLQHAMELYDSIGTTDRRKVCEEKLFFFNFMNKDFASVKSYLNKRTLLSKSDSLLNNRFLYKWLANQALIENNLEDWKTYSDKYDSAEVLFTNEKIQKAGLELETKYNVAKKDIEIAKHESESKNRFWIIIALALGLVIIAIAALAQYFINKSKQKLALQQQELSLAEERIRIATDLHDDMGAGISRIRFLGEGVKHILQAEKAKEDVNTMIGLSDDLVDKMNEIIWTLNTGNEQLQEIFYYIRSQCSQLVNDAAVGFESIIPDNLPTIIYSAAQKRNIYLVIKEAVHNALKHAQASQIKLMVAVDKSLNITVADNGKGFDVNTAKRSGNGLYNYEKRMKALNGKVKIESSNTGSKVCFIIRL